MPEGYRHARLSDMRWFLIAVFSLTCLAAPVLATDLEDALRAYHQERYAEAHRGFQMLAAANSAEAAYYLGVMYDNGWGVPRDDPQAAEWYHRAARQGSYFAQYSLGVMYDQGEGVAQNSELALMWITVASRSGSPSAATLAKQLRGNMSKSAVDAARTKAHICVRSNFQNCF